LVKQPEIKNGTETDGVAEAHVGGLDATNRGLENSGARVLWCYRSHSNATVGSLAQALKNRKISTAASP
jgi:hypothetical protein